MARTQTMVQLNDDLVKALDHEAQRAGCSRSEYIRRTLIEHLDRTSVAEMDRRFVESYRSSPQPDIDEWGDLTAFAAHSSTEAFRTLDAEEEAAGLSW